MSRGSLGILASFPGSHAREREHWSCAGVESLLFFCHVKSAKDRREVDATLIVRGRMRLRTEKGTKVADNLLYISSYRALTHRALKRSWLNAQTVPFGFCPILNHDYVMLTYERYQALHAIHIRVMGEPAWERGYGDLPVKPDVRISWVGVL